MKSYNIITPSFKPKLSVVRVESNVWHDLHFDKHHYLSQKLNKSAKCLVFLIENEVCAFIALLNSPRKGKPNGYSISRIVILPDFQGMGLFSIILNFCGGIIKNLGDDFELYIKTVHARAGKSLQHNNNWKPTSYNGKIRKVSEEEKHKYANRLTRASYCYKYSGQKIDGYEDILLPIGILRQHNQHR